MDKDSCGKLASTFYTSLQAECDSLKESVSSKSQHKYNGSGLADSLTRLLFVTICRIDFISSRRSVFDGLRSGRESIILTCDGTHFDARL